jgi:peptidyl-tRNA hydrolase ICT1
MHPALRASRFYTSRNDSITIQAQTQRSRTANTDENVQKLVEEIRRIYRETVPGVTSDKKVKKYEAL